MAEYKVYDQYGREIVPRYKMKVLPTDYIVYDYEDTVGNRHWYGTQSGEHIEKENEDD